MADHGILDAVLDNTQVPHQPLVVIVDSAVFSGLPLFRESLRRALNRLANWLCMLLPRLTYRGGPVLLINALHDAETLNAGGATVVSLGVPGYADVDGSEDELDKRVLGACASPALHSQQGRSDGQTLPALRCTSMPWTSSPRTILLN